MNKKFAKRDLFINLLPREYLPEPEFKLFFVFAILFIGGLGWILFSQWQAMDVEYQAKVTENDKLQVENDSNIIKIVPIPVIQANSRYILSYLHTLPGIIELGPDWLNVYIQLENEIPGGVWMESMSFVGGNDQGVWPGIIIRGVSTEPQAVEKVLNLAEDLENSNQFIGLTLRGWEWVNLDGGGRGVSFQMDMGIER